MRIILLSLVFFTFVSCQNFRAEEEPVPQIHHISKKEESSKEVKEHLDEPYVSSYGEIQMDDNEQVDKWINYFQTAGRDRMETYLSRSTRYLPMMKNVLREYRLPEDLVYVAMIESGFSPLAHSFANAVGYWQFIEGTGKRYGLKVDSFVDERRDPVLSTRAAAEYFKDLYGAFESWQLALASYNTGEYRVSRAVMRHYTRDFWYLSSKRSLPRETANYVPKFIAAVRISKEPEKYGFHNVEHQPPLQYDAIKLDFPISLKKLAVKLGITYKEIRHLNPRYRGEYVPIEEETMIRVPVGKKELVASMLAECRMNKPQYVYSDHYWYRVRRGDTLYRLARRNRTTVSTIRRMNKMNRRSILRAGRKIKMPYYNRAVKRNRKYALAGSHVVKKGEGLNAIAKKYKVKVSVLRKINNLNSSSVIHPGQVLKLVADSHVVKKGESLNAIAKKYRVTVSALRKINNLNSSSVIHPGQKIKLVKDNKEQRSTASSSGKFHTVRRGETLISIAKKYNVSLPLLMEKNKLNFKSILVAGRQIVIPQ